MLLKNAEEGYVASLGIITKTLFTKNFCLIYYIYCNSVKVFLTFILKRIQALFEIIILL